MKDQVVAMKPKIIVGLGRGGSGKSTGLAEIIQRARQADRNVVVADGDARSKTLSEWFPDALRPQSEEIEDVKAFISNALDLVLTKGASVVFDFGGGDKSIQDYGRDLNLIEFAADNGIELAAISFLGPDPEDLSHVYTLWKAKVFRPQRHLLVMNEGVIRQGKTVAGAFDATVKSVQMEEMVKAGSTPLLMNRLAVMDKIKAAKASIYDPGTALSMLEKQMVKQWVRYMDGERQKMKVDAWLP